LIKVPILDQHYNNIKVKLWIPRDRLGPICNICLIDIRIGKALILYTV